MMNVWEKEDDTGLTITIDYEASGQFVTLYEKLREDEERFCKYFRMILIYYWVGINSGDI